MWGSCFERNSCQDFNLELYGLTRPLFLEFVAIASKDDYEREKRLYNVMGLLLTGEPIIKDSAQKSSYLQNNKVNVEAKKKDILYDFPYDVQYPAEKLIRDNLKYWAGKKEEEIENELEFWDDKRANAARGKLGVIARRCSINGLLWAEYNNGVFPDQQSLKNRVKLDHIRMALYPIGFPTDKICIEPPPKNHWDTLRTTKELHRFLRELNIAGFTALEEVVPLDKELELIANEVKEEMKLEGEAKNG